MKKPSVIINKKVQPVAWFITKLGQYTDDLLVVSGIGFLAAAGFVIHLALGLAVLGVGLIGYGIFVSLGR